MFRANSPNPNIARRASVNWIMLIYFTSGACSLIDEVVWVRLLKLTLGNTVYASSIVVSMFMGGLALGALIMGDIPTVSKSTCDYMPYWKLS